MTNSKKEKGKFEGFVKPLTEVVEKHREWTKEEKVKMAGHMKRSAERDLDEHMKNMLEKAKRLVQDLERNQARYFSEEENKKSSYFQYSLDEVSNCFGNYRMLDAARKLAKYEKADALLKTLKW